MSTDDQEALIELVLKGIDQGRFALSRHEEDVFRGIYRRYVEA